jgi:hypothetical protein
LPAAERKLVGDAQRAARVQAAAGHRLAHAVSTPSKICCADA